jgi:Zn-dependent protease
MTQVAIMLITLIVSLTVHEAAHAFVGMLGGDLTAYRGGQVSLNPVPHIRREPFGMVVLPVLSLVLSNGTYCMGFAHAPYDPIWAYHHPRKAALMSAAGPVANVLLAALALGVLWMVGDGHRETAVGRIAWVFLFLNVLLAVFNFVPLPPLDGAGIVAGLVPATRRFYDALARIPNVSLLVIVGMVYFFPHLFAPVWEFVVRLVPR